MLIVINGESVHIIKYVHYVAYVVINNDNIWAWNRKVH
jgi:hypothetical protein